MKKRSVAVFCAMFAALLLGLSACASTPEHEHEWGKWTSAGSGVDSVHERVCECGESESAVHEWDGGTVVLTSTCTLDGEKRYTCTVCGATRKETVPASHDFENVTPTWEWSGYASAVATFKCKNCTKTESVTADGQKVTSAVTTAPGCETTGLRTYTAKVSYLGKDYTDAKTEVLPETGHDYKEDVISPTCDGGGIPYIRVTTAATAIPIRLPIPPATLWQRPRPATLRQYARRAAMATVR